jgi:hypothetical protein
MKKYMLTIQGKNFLTQFGSKKEKWGFFITRVARAETIHQAEEIVLDRIRGELRNVVLNDHTDEPMMYVLEVSEITSRKNPIQGEGGGFSWYPENPEKNDIWSEEGTNAHHRQEEKK